MALYERKETGLTLMMHILNVGFGFTSVKNEVDDLKDVVMKD